MRDWGANSRLFSAPMPSADAQVTIFNAKDIFGDTATDSLQALATIPGLPAWLTPVGQGYRYEGDAKTERNISFSYLHAMCPRATSLG